MATRNFIFRVPALGTEYVDEDYKYIMISVYAGTARVRVDWGRKGILHQIPNVLEDYVTGDGRTRRYRNVIAVPC